MTRFGLVRHGQTDANLHDLFQGSSDNPLNATGVAQAHRALTGAAAQIAWDAVISSDLQRAERTARIIAEDHGLRFAGTDPRLREIDWGAAEGMPTREAEERWPGRSFPGREDAQSVGDRASESLREIARTYGSRNVLIVAHGTLIRLLVAGILGESIASIPNGTYSEILADGEAWTVTMVAGEPWEAPARILPARGYLPLDPDHLIPRRPTEG